LLVSKLDWIVLAYAAASGDAAVEGRSSRAAAEVVRIPDPSPSHRSTTGIGQRG